MPIDRKRRLHGGKTFSSGCFALLMLLSGCSTPTATAPNAPASQPTLLAATLQPCSAAGEATISALQTPAPVTPAAVSPTVAPPTPSAPPPPTATPRPAPQVDRVGFPDGYQDSFKLIYVYDRSVSKQVRVACANDVAASAKPGEPFPYGSVILFESWRPKETAAGDVVKDGNGKLVREALTTIFVMRKEKGFGEEYKDIRNGEWEYVAYRPDKSVQTPPQASFSCAACHLAASQERDFVFRGNLEFVQDHYGQTPNPGPNEVTLDSIAFAPAAKSIKAGTTITWNNRDVAPHQLSSTDKSFASEAIKPGQSFSFTFNTPGTYDYFCAIHPEQMRGARITVSS